MKKLAILALTGMMVMEAACGVGTEEETQATETVVESVVETPAETTVESEAPAEETVESETPAETTEAETASEEVPAPVETEPAAEAAEQETEQSAGGYEDNFSVDAEAVKAFAGEVKAAVAAKDLEAFADLASYPVYIDLDGGTVLESRDEMIALGADAVFTEQLMASVAAADENALSPSMAGFSLSDGSTSNVIFGVVDGELAITGINY